jgi:hypothetical protein
VEEITERHEESLSMHQLSMLSMQGSSQSASYCWLLFKNTNSTLLYIILNDDDDDILLYCIVTMMFVEKRSENSYFSFAFLRLSSYFRWH